MHHDTLLTALVIAAAGCTIWADLTGRRRLVYVFKPLTTVLILLIALLKTGTSFPIYRLALILGLTASLGGDVFLMLPGRFFVAGLSSFLVAHLLYIGGIASTGISVGQVWRFLPFAAYAAALYLYLRPRLTGLRPAVLAYSLVITSMAWLAWERAVQTPGLAAGLAAAGALLFVASDSALAINRFARPVRAAPLVVLGTYYAAQLLLAHSI